MALTIVTTAVLHSRPGTRRGFVTDAEARRAARHAGLDYKLSMASSSLGMPPEVRAARKPNRSEPAYIVGVGNQRFDRPILHAQWLKSKACNTRRQR